MKSTSDAKKQRKGFSRPQKNYLIENGLDTTAIGMLEGRLLISLSTAARRSEKDDERITKDLRYVLSKLALSAKLLGTLESINGSPEIKSMPNVLEYTNTLAKCLSQLVEIVNEGNLAINSDRRREVSAPNWIAEHALFAFTMIKPAPSGIKGSAENSNDECPFEIEGKNFIHVVECCLDMLGIEADARNLIRRANGTLKNSDPRTPENSLRIQYEAGIADLLEWDLVSGAKDES